MEEKLRKEIAELFRVERVKRDETQTEFAKFLKISPRTLASIEHGVKVRDNTLISALDKINVNLSKVVTYELILPDSIEPKK